MNPFLHAATYLAYKNRSTDEANSSCDLVTFGCHKKNIAVTNSCSITKLKLVPREWFLVLKYPPSCHICVSSADVRSTTEFVSVDIWC